MSEEQRKPTCPRCKGTILTFVGDNTNLADNIFHPEISHPLIQVYQCECGMGFTFTVLPPGWGEQQEQR